MLIPSLISYAIDFTTSLRRLQKFLLSEEIENNIVTYGNPEDSLYSVEINKVLH